MNTDALIGVEELSNLFPYILIALYMIGLIINLIYFIFFRKREKKEFSFASWIPVIMTVGVGAIVMEMLRFSNHFDKLVKKIDEKLLVKRFWLVGKAYKKSLEMIK